MQPTPLKALQMIKGRHYWVLGGVFVLVQLILLFRFGIETGLEAEKYIEQGTRLWQGEGLGEEKYLFYAPVILLVWLLKSLGLPLFIVCVFQVLLSGFSQFCFYKVMKRMAGADLALCGSLLLLFFIPYQIWNLFLYSDSIFQSTVLLLGCSIYYSLHNRRILYQVLPFLLLAIVFFSRPNGMFLIPPFIIFLVLQQKPFSHKLFAAFISLAFIILAAVCANYIFANGNDMNILLPYIEEHIICFVPTRDAASVLHLSQTGSALGDFWYYVSHNSLHFIKMTFLRLGSIFTLNRPYYGTSHNIYLLGYSLMIYGLAIVGIKRFIRMKSGMRPFIFSLILLYPFAIVFNVTTGIAGL
ncbi:MAG: glycosyltransferase family 39 protein [Chitinophagaceae bacterium]|nr:glycosyltransferase family 39 protein [Chitinophagaceae bacterium]